MPINGVMGLESRTLLPVVISLPINKGGPMLDKKFLEVLESPPDSALAIASQGPQGVHLVNSWNSYVLVKGDKLLIPAGRMQRTQENLELDSRVKLTISNREVQGRSYKGTGFLVEGRAHFDSREEDYLLIKERFPWARAALVIEVEKTTQTL